MYSRRELGKLALAASAGAVFGRPVRWLGRLGQSRPDSRISGVQVGLIVPYSLGREAGDAEGILQSVAGIGISAVEMQASPVEAFAGRPASASGGRRRGRGAPTDEQRAAAAALREWRLSVPMERFAALRRHYDDAGVSIYAFKFDDGLDAAMSDDEYDYAFSVAEALGASHLTMEQPEDESVVQRIGTFSRGRRVRAAFHIHRHDPEAALTASPDVMSNIDVGHYVGVTGRSPLPFFEKFHDRIASFHMKDRRTPDNGGDNMPWGEGDTPLADLLRLVQRNRWTMPATIELEYRVPEGSTRAAEIGKCLEYCRRALA